MVIRSSFECFKLDATLKSGPTLYRFDVRGHSWEEALTIFWEMLEVLLEQTLDTVGVHDVIPSSIREETATPIHSQRPGPWQAAEATNEKANAARAPSGVNLIAFAFILRVC